nr:immunoglobulin heavy chain junction region [Macaca mulatta]MOX38254.1 immunoglobulin heavy chain junction region [Macaca mulatta]MOX38325.1 immunoglobulin heavy chain junction region [Macaca mulatta]MOX38576.1 immunoglobulin heavy chain junction region [Macaca mulatta]MOX39156.1 immunoglobulin heavy chain junction region [Macaca mulatta]
CARDGSGDGSFDSW